MSDAPAPAAPAAAPAAPAAPADAPITNLLADAKPAETAAPAPVDGATAADKPAEAARPEAAPYTDLKLPEGIKADDATLGTFLKDAQEANLTKDQTQKLIDKYAGKLTTVEDAKAAVDAGNKLWKDTQSKWQDEVKADPEVGGANLQTNLAGIAKFIDQFAGSNAAKVREALNFTGAGNNPEIVRFFHNAAKAFVGKSTVTGGKPANVQFTTHAERLYGSSGGNS